MSAPLHVTIVGGGMITHDQLLPSIYHLQRTGLVADISICAIGSAALRALAESPFLISGFPGQGFKAFPDLGQDSGKSFPRLFEEAIRQSSPGSLVIVAVPDALHYTVIKAALAHGQHVLSVKPLVLFYRQAVEIERIAREKGLFVGIEYHKRFDRRSLETRASYRQGKFGEFRCGEAKLIEPWHYRHSNFQTWFTKENTDPFTYIGCHYVDLVYFMTGLRPTGVSLEAVEGRFPNGNVGYLWSHGRVQFENGALLGVMNGLGYPESGAGSNDQGMCLFCEGKDAGGLIKHDDQFRGVTHAYVKGPPSGSAFRFINPDYLRLVAWQGSGLRPVGYGYDSVEASVLAVKRIRDEIEGLDKDRALARARALIDEIDAAGLIATPKNSSINELVIEAARLSLANGGRHAVIEYGAAPGVGLR